MKKDWIQNIIKTALFLAAIALIMFGYHTNNQYKKSMGIDTSSGATQVESKKD